MKYAEAMLTLDLSRAAFDSIVAHAQRDAPNECCGLLVGKGARVERAVATLNEAEQPRRHYRVNPAEQFVVIRDLRGTDREIVGAYHSHPSAPAAPSPTDIAEAWPAPFVYLIVSLDGACPDLRAYVIDEGNVIPVPLRTTPA